MCNFVVPIRTCSKCYQKQPLFDEKEIRSSRVGGKKERGPTSMEPAQDCYSRWCTFSSEHQCFCGSCWLTCKHTHGKAREIRGGSPSYVCHSCVSCPERNCLSQPPHPGGNDMLRRQETGWFTRLTRYSAK